MYNLVHVILGTAIPTSLCIFLKMFLILVCALFGILTKDVVLTNIYQMLANESKFSATYQGQGAQPLQKVPDLTNT